jgi:16S rRNA (adenine1518-N6/adenine1519-N6)-dimethyltransferase
MQPKKSLGQNFLMHRRIAERIVMVAGAVESDTVLEIGPGTGMLTRALLEKAGKVIAVEADAELVLQLKETFNEEIKAGRLELIEGDVREFDPAAVGGRYLLIANIPYYITGEIIRKFLTTPNKPASLTLLVQKEVAVRIARSKKESLLSLSVKVFGTPKYEFTVPRGAFFPAPNVDSAVLSVTNIHSPFASTDEEEHFFQILHAGFAHKRKQLAGNLSELYPPEVVKNALEQTGLKLTIRAEDVPLQAWQKMVDFLKN